jgi:predicted benzoate:H+ symporter BenE
MADMAEARTTPGQRPARSGSYRADTIHGPRGPVPDVKIRCAAQPADAAPLFARPRFVWSLNELSGALGDLGTFLPHVIGAITVAGMAPSGVLIWFGLFYLAAGAYYGVPMGVQPMKAASAAVLIQQTAPGEVAGAGLVIGAFFLIAGLSGLVTRLARVIPAAVTAGVQLGLGLSLAVLGVRLVEAQPWLGLIVGVVMLAQLANRRVPAALAGLALGVALSRLAPGAAPLPSLSVGLHLPPVVWPSWAEVVRGTEVMVLPQIPLTLTNAIIVTAAVTHQLFPKEIHHVTERNLAISTGLGNLIAAPFGGYLMCHGAGGIAGHYRFGARSAAAPAIIGVTFLALGLLGGSAIAVLALIPAAVLGALLFFSGLELALSARPHTFAGEHLVVVLVVAAISVAANPAAAFLLGLPLVYVLRRGWVRL